MSFPPTASMRLLTRMERARGQALRPPPSLSLIEWADSFRKVAKENSANPGQWQTRRVPAAFGPMAAVTEADTQVVTMMACTQLIKSEMLINTACYFIHQDPASILFVQPTQSLAENFSKERFAPTRSATAVIKALVADPKSRDSGTTITHKEYPGGSLDFVGANSPVDLASRPKRVTLADEIDLYPADAGGMGDPLDLAEERSSTFRRRRKNIRVCSPSLEESSRVYREYQASDRRRCFVACPHCDHEQVLRWSRETVIWDKDESGNHMPWTVQYFCEACGTGWSEAERIGALRALAERSDHGWRQTKPFRCCDAEHHPSKWTDNGRSLCPICDKPSPYDGHAGFQVSKLYSTRHELQAIVREWLNAQNSREKLKKFTNTALAEVWKEKVERLDAKSLAERAEPYTAETIPAPVKLVTWGADTQDDRIEVTFLGWGLDEECWILKHDVLMGSTAKKAVWDQLDELVKEPFTTETGRRLIPQAGCIDSQGHRGEMVHAFCRARKNRRIYAIKGQANDSRGSKLIWPKTPSRSKNSGDRLYLVGVDTAKDNLAARLAIPIDATKSGEGGWDATPFAIHFPQTGLSFDYYEQLTAEKAVTVFEAGREYRVWRKKSPGLRNEALDCFVYGMAARLSLPDKLRSRAKIAERRPEPDAEEKSVERASFEPETGGTVSERATAVQQTAPKPLKRVMSGRWGAYRS